MAALADSLKFIIIHLSQVKIALYNKKKLNENKTTLI